MPHEWPTLLSWRSKVFTPVDMTFSWPLRSASSSSRTDGATRYTRFGRVASSLRVTCASTLGQAEYSELQAMPLGATYLVQGSRDLDMW